MKIFNKPMLMMLALALAALLGLGISAFLHQRVLAQAQGQSECTVTVQPGESIQAAIDGAAEGAVICLAAGHGKRTLGSRRA